MVVGRWLQLVATATNVKAAGAEQPAGLCVTAADARRWGQAMKVLIIQIARSIVILAWSDQTRPGVLSQRLSALRFWPSCRQRRSIH